MRLQITITLTCLLLSACALGWRWGGRLGEAPRSGMGSMWPLPDGQESLRDAVGIGRTRDPAVYSAFTADYFLPGSGEVQNVEIITEFRRAVMIVRAYADAGEYAFNENNLARVMPPYRGLVTFIAQLGLHPLHVYPAPPKYEMFVRTGPSTKPIQPARFKREPVYSLGSEDRSMTGFRLELSVARAEINDAAAPTLMIVNDHADVIWQAPLDLSRYR